LFWLVWGFVLSWNLLILLAKRSADAALPAKTPAARGWWNLYVPRIVWGGLILSTLVMGFPALLLYGPEAPSYPRTIVALALLIPAFFHLLFHWVGVLANRSAARRAGSRRLLAGLAGGLLLWCGVYGWVAERERHWAARDTVIVPSIINGRIVAFTQIEGHIVNRYHEHVGRILTEEGIRNRE